MRSRDSSGGLPTRFCFVLIDDFTLISMATAIETLRMANRVAKKNVYQWKTVSEDGRPVCASDGLSVNVDFGLTEKDALKDVDAVVVCGGKKIESHTSEPMLRWLKTVGRTQCHVGGICTGSYVLARAGLLDGYRCSIHWENVTALTDSFPKAQVSRSIYTIDRNRFTSSGGTAPLDMLLYFVRQQYGLEVCADIADQFVYERVRKANDLQRIPLRHSVGKQSKKLVVVVELMEANVREPISQVELAEFAGLSRRQLQRLFKRYLLCTPSRYYLQIRLQNARQLLHQTDLTLDDVCARTGFVSRSHFSKSYKEYYGYSPSAERRPSTP